MLGGRVLHGTHDGGGVGDRARGMGSRHVGEDGRALAHEDMILVALAWAQAASGLSGFLNGRTVLRGKGVEDGRGSGEGGGVVGLAAVVAFGGGACEDFWSNGGGPVWSSG